MTPCLLCGAPAREWTRGPLTDPTGARFDAVYRRCEACGLVFLDPAFHPTIEAEKARYSLHRNGPGDSGHLEWMLGVAERGLLPFIAPGETILDYGAGPFPALEHLLAPLGYEVLSWDPLFAPDPAPLARRYRAVACIEVAEHFRSPKQDFAKIAGLLEIGGLLCLRTLPPPEDPDAFSKWWYRQDPTHLAFYSPRAVEWAGEGLGTRVVFSDSRGIYALRRTNG